MRVDAVVRNIEVIGEAATHLDAATIALCPDVEWQDVKGMRTLVAHQYLGVSVAIVWTTVVRDIPVLKRQVMQALENLRIE